MTTTILPQTPATAHSPLAKGIAVGLVAASIGALYTVFARWGIAHGLSSPDLTVLRFGVAGILMVPVLALACWRDMAQFTGRWRVWLSVALLAGTPFGLLMFGALQFAPSSHAAIFPFTAMSVMGMVLGAVVLGDRMTGRRVAGIAVVLTGLVLVSGVEASSLTWRAAIGDAMFLAAGTLWAGFGIVLRKHRLDPLLATAVISISSPLCRLMRGSHAVRVWLWRRPLCCGSRCWCKASLPARERCTPTPKWCRCWGLRGPRCFLHWHRAWPR